MENKRKGVYNICVVARLIGTVLYTDRVAVLVNLVKITDIVNIE